MYKKIKEVTFPEFSNININMMPMIMGDINSIPEQFHGYKSLIDSCDFKLGTTVYLTISETFVEANKFQRRPGIHTEGTREGNWGGGGWGGYKEHEGLYIASNDGRTKIYDYLTVNVDTHGSVLNHNPDKPSEVLAPNNLYWLTDRTPHEAMPVEKDTHRQFFRLVSENVDLWWENHSTRNPLGIEPKCKVLTGNKFSGY